MIMKKMIKCEHDDIKMIIYDDIMSVCEKKACVIYTIIFYIGKYDVKCDK